MPTSPHAYFSLGAQFLRLSYEVSVELVKSRNPHLVVSDVPLAPGEYEHRTRWSDHMVGIAALFNRFHGIELILKGFLGARGRVPKHHRLTDLLKEFDRLYPGEPLTGMIHAAFDTSQQDSPLATFFRANALQLDQWYEALKYPELRDGTAVDHFGLKYGGESSAPFWAGLAESAATIQRRAVSLAHSLSIA
jgi:hypothetical protein